MSYLILGGDFPLWIASPVGAAAWTTLNRTRLEARKLFPIRQASDPHSLLLLGDQYNIYHFPISRPVSSVLYAYVGIDIAPLRPSLPPSTTNDK